MSENKIAELSQGFSKLDQETRFARLLDMGFLKAEDIDLLKTSCNLPINLAEKFIENVLGYFPIPLGIAVNFNIDKQDYVIPMAVEETSIIAAASKTAKWIREQGEISTKTLGELAIGQIQIAKVANYTAFENKILSHKLEFIKELNEHVVPSLVQRGGGVKDIELRQILRPDGLSMAIIHILVNTCDAMGANLINQICEYLKETIEKLTQERVSMAILSNLNDQKLTSAQIILRNIDEELGHSLAEASLFAELDPYRAATNNKGVLNGMDAVLVATGNDWRAVEAGVHAYAAQKGQYRSITRWRMEGRDLIGTLEAPISVGIVGGVTMLHPIAKLSMQILGVKSANELARIVAAVGLVQNLGALRALTTVGIIEGHMKLHIDNLSLGAGAKENELPLLKKRLEEFLLKTKRVSLSNAQQILLEIRNEQNVFVS